MENCVSGAAQAETNPSAAAGAATQGRRRPSRNVKRSRRSSRPLGLPGTSMDDVIRGAMSGRGGINSQGSAQIPSSKARNCRHLLSDPNGVVFKPQPFQVRASVERAGGSSFQRTDTAVVSIQFAIQRDGTVRKGKLRAVDGDARPRQYGR